MGNRKFQLTSAEIGEIGQLLTQCGSNTAPFRRLNAVRMYGSGISIDVIRERYGCSRSTLLGWCKDFRLLGAESLVDMRSGGNNARLNAQQLADLLGRLRACTPGMVFGQSAASPDGECWTVKDLYRAMREWYGVAYQSRNSYYRMLKKYHLGEAQRPERHGLREATNVQF